MTGFAATFESFEVDGIVYDPYEAEADSSARPPLLDLKTDGKCYCGEETPAWWTCSGDSFRWLPGQLDMPPLRFGAEQDGGQ